MKVKQNLIGGCFMGFFGFLGCILIALIIIAVYHAPQNKSQFYVPNENIYLKMERSIGQHYGRIYVGKTKDDINNKCDYFDYKHTDQRGDYSILIKKKGTDSIYVQSSCADDFRLMNTTSFVFSIVEDMDYYRTLDKTVRRIANNPSDYCVLLIDWNQYWHESNYILLWENYTDYYKWDMYCEDNYVSIPAINE